MHRLIENKPGGMAWINANVDHGCGEGALISRLVRTVRMNEFGLWEIEPAQQYTVTRWVVFADGALADPGCPMDLTALGDECLSPINGDGVTDKEVADLYAPRPPVRTRVPA